MLRLTKLLLYLPFIPPYKHFLISKSPDDSAPHELHSQGSHTLNFSSFKKILNMKLVLLFFISFWQDYFFFFIQTTIKTTTKTTMIKVGIKLLSSSWSIGFCDV